MPCAAAPRTTARTAAFMPGASPPLVKTATRRSLRILTPPLPLRHALAVDSGDITCARLRLIVITYIATPILSARRLCDQPERPSAPRPCAVDRRPNLGLLPPIPAAVEALTRGHRALIRWQREWKRRR